VETVRQLRNLVWQPAVFPAGPGRLGDQTANGLEPEKAKTYEIGTRYNDDVWGGK
jgi:Fe(3+) dicitrate transport protein